MSQSIKVFSPFLAILLFSVIARAEDCIPKDFGFGSIVCVCNATYCDSTPIKTPDVPEEGSFHWYVSSKAGDRLKFSEGRFSEEQASSVVLEVDREIKYQSIDGFGGAFTDSAGIIIRNLSEKTQSVLMDQYFGQSGSRYNLGRVPIGGCDFSVRSYTYDDVVGDVSLKQFSLAQEDYDYKIPLIQKASSINKELRLLAAAWTAPPWMKTNNDYYGYGFLKKEYYQTYTDYLIKFLSEYKKHGIDIWAISTGNEPSNAFIPVTRISTMGWKPKDMGKWVAENLGPTLEAHFNETLILALDDQRFMLPWYINLLFENTKAMNYIDGIATHYYWDKFVTPDLMNQTHNNFPSKFLITTEACAGDRPWDNPKVALGDWKRGEAFFLDILQNINHWSTGFIDWNLALDQQGGPNWIGNFVDASIIVNHEKDEFYKQCTYYAIKHFSRFICRGSIRIETNIHGHDKLKSTAFLTPDKKIAVLIYNKNNKNQCITIKDKKSGLINLDLQPNSMNTILYSQ